MVQKVTFLGNTDAVNFGGLASARQLQLLKNLCSRGKSAIPAGRLLKFDWQGTGLLMAFIKQRKARQLHCYDKKYKLHYVRL